MHVKHYIIRVFTCLMLLVCFMVPNCCASTLEGTWFPSDLDMSYYKYPEPMTLKPDGSGIVDGFLVAWSEENGIFTIYTVLGSLSFEYRFDGQTLYLDDHPYLQKKNTEAQSALILPNESIWKTSILDLGELLETDPTLAYMSESNQRFFAYARKESTDLHYPGKATYYFLDDKLGCIIFELTEAQCHDYINSLSKNSGRAREGRSPLENKSCPAACTAGAGGFLRRKIPFSRAKIVSLQFMRPEI